MLTVRRSADGCRCCSYVWSVNAFNDPHLSVTDESFSKNNKRAWIGTGEQQVEQPATTFLPRRFGKYSVLQLKCDDFLLKKPVHDATLWINFRYKVSVHPHDLCSNRVVCRNACKNIKITAIATTTCLAAPKSQLRLSGAG